MPIYEYRCGECQHKLEAIQKFSDAPLVVCPACGRDALSKLVSAAGFHLKGSGWYQTDFRGNGGARKPDAAEGAEKPATETAAKTDASTAKPDAPAKTGDDTAAAAKPATPAPPSTSA